MEDRATSPRGENKPTNQRRNNYNNRNAGQGTGAKFGGNGRPNNKRPMNNAGAKRPPVKKPFAKRIPASQKIARENRRKLSKQKFDATYEVVHKEFPKCFNVADILPLPVDVHRQLFEHFHSQEQGPESPVKKSAIRHFLQRYVRSEAYHNAVLSRAKRYNLDGESFCDFSKDELDYHRKCLAEIKLAQQPKKPERKPLAARRPNNTNNNNNKGDRPQQRFAPKPNNVRQGAPAQNRNDRNPQAERHNQVERNNQTERGNQAERHNQGDRNTQGNRNFRPQGQPRRQIRPVVTDMSKFKVGVQVLCGDKKGVVKGIQGDKIRVAFEDSSLLYLFPAESARIL